MKQKLWCCVDTNFDSPIYYLPSLSHRKRDSILVMTTAPAKLKWSEFKEIGFECIKVEITINPINEVK